MAAYAALVSLMHIIDQIQQHPRPPISLEKDQVQSLTEKVTFLQEYLGVYSHVHNKEADGLQSRIAEVAYEAEDVIESHIADQILAQSTANGEKIGTPLDFFPGLQRVTQSMDLIKKEVIKLEQKMGSIPEIQVHRSDSIPMAGSSRSPLKEKNIMVGLDEVLIQLMDKLTGLPSNRQIISIAGMGGIGKTTLARNAYEHPFVVQYFDIRVWVTISQEYNTKEILLEALFQTNQEAKDNFSGESEGELGQMLHKTFYRRRYLIVIDDIWTIEALEKIMFFFPDNNNGSRVIITTRLSNIALHLPSASSLEMNFLNEELSWNLLCKIVFREDGCPHRLDKIGRKIAQNCRGLPLSIVVIGGLLAKSEKTREYWKHIAENLNSIVNYENNEHCFKLLYLSYNYLPVHLKPCFLYMGVFSEDSKIHVSDLIRLWVAEGFLKPIIDKSLEDAGEEYLKQLIDRNLILTLECKSTGKIKFCQIHDLVRDLCLREAQKDNFLCVTKLHNFGSFPQWTNAKRRIAIHGSKLKKVKNDYLPQNHDALQSPSLARSLICESSPILPFLDSKLLRVMQWPGNYYYLENIFSRGVSLRYIAVLNDMLQVGGCPSGMPSFIYLCWNLHTLIDRVCKSIIKIWKVPLLRHVEFFRILLPDLPSDEQNDFVMENLHTLSNVVNFRCSEKMAKMISNIKKLRICYDDEKFKGSHYCLNNLACLHKLESLNLHFLVGAKPSHGDLMQNLTFPHSLKKLTLNRSCFQWEDISSKIGSLPLLQVLKLGNLSVEGPEWRTVEGQFRCLKVLLIEYHDLQRWTTESTHFPCLEHLCLTNLTFLEEIPSSIGEIPTLQTIELTYCSDSAILSAKQIVEEQEQYGNENLQVRVQLAHRNPVLLDLASCNFQVEVPI